MREFHGHSPEGRSSPTYRSWASMKSRCLNPNFPAFKGYGARGIEVCERWLSFKNFLDDMGERPVGTSLDRVDVNGNYEPGNCRWSTPKEQSSNRRDTVWLSYGSETFCLQDLADKFGLNRETLIRRVFDLNWPEDRWAESPRKWPSQQKSEHENATIN